MTARMLAQRIPLMDKAQLEAVVEQTCLPTAWHTLAEQDRHRLELLIDDCSGPVVEVAPDFSVACGVVVASELLEHQGTTCERWTVRVLAWDEEIGAWILLREWRSQE
ncbi:MAG: hypothetical protein ABR592_12195 [Nitriliruptorales bacterium]